LLVLSVNFALWSVRASRGVRLQRWCVAVVTEEDGFVVVEIVRVCLR
jgi:hypothetical protein